MHNQRFPQGVWFAPFHRSAQAISFNGSGVFNRLHSWVTDKNNGLKISSSRMDADTDDIASGLSNCICKDGQTTVTADISLASHKLTNLTSGTIRSDAANLGQVQDATVNWLADSGTADALAAIYSPALTTLVDGQLCFVRAANANATTTPTFAPNGLTAHTIVKYGSTALVAGDIAAGQDLILRYDLDNTQWELLNPSNLTGGTITGKIAMSGAAINETSATLASAATVNIGAAAGNYLIITGTTTITAFDTVQSGTERTLKFSGALTLTHNATSLILPGGVNIATAAGDTACFRSEGSGNWRCMWYRFASALSGKQPTRTVKTSGSGTYTTPSGATRINVRMRGGGGGGGGGNTGTLGTTGGSTTFGTLTAAGGGGGSNADTIGTGGAGTNGDVNVSGGDGDTGAPSASGSTAAGKGGRGGGAGGGAGGYAAAGHNGQANTGGGGGGGGIDTNGSNLASGTGGGEGAYVEKLITAPSATYSYAVGAGSAGATGGTSGHTGGTGGSGLIIIEEFYD